MDISVIVPFYNAEKFIEECIRGLLSQSYPRESYEIIMVDNNSKDASAEIVKQYPRIKLLSGSKQGAYAARNRGISEAQGSIIAFTDPDCVPDEIWLRHIATAMQSQEIRIVIGGYQPPPSTFLSLLNRYENERNLYIFNSRISDLYYGYANNMAVRRELFDTLGPFMERRRGADAIFVRRAVETHSCNTVRYCPEARVQHLEIDSLRMYYQKKYIYGYSGHLCEKEAAWFRQLNNKERWLVFQRTVKGERYKLIKSAILFLLTSGSLISHEAGRLSAIVKTQNLKR